MRSFLVGIAALFVAVPLASQGHDHHAGHGSGEPAALPAGWQVRLDRADAPLDQVRFREAGGAFHVTLGPSAIFYDPSHQASGEYTARATFTQTRETPHAEGYGLIIGGRDLDGPAQDYLYFLVRQDGRFLIKHRAGDETHTITEWTEHPAILKVDGDRAATNTLAIEAGPQRARFLVNGAEVALFTDVPYLNTAGIAGLRVNHNLDLHVADFAVEPR